ncbi:hypothetical protein [Dickeya dadantii]|uniref:hypothetical protein n=1 Tax=Dickeya dadantii TaxID=204038 RepID=UPI003459B78E
MNIPIGALALLMGLVVLPKTAPGERKPFDMTGYVLVSAGIGLLMVAPGDCTMPRRWLTHSIC